MDQFLTDGTEKMRLAAAWITKGQHVLCAIYKRTFEQDIDMSIHRMRKTLPVERVHRFLQWKLRLPHQTDYAVLPSNLPFTLHDLEQIVLVAQFLTPGFFRLLLVALPDRWQMERLQAF